MECSVVIPCHNGEPLTRACITSLRQQTRGFAPAEIVLVDNASTDATAELAAMHPTVRVLRLPENRGFAGGVNAGIAAARHELVLVLNNDTRAAATMLSELQRALALDPNLAAVAPTSNHVKGAAKLDVGDCGRTVEGRAAITAELAGAPVLQDVDTLAGLCLLVRRATFAAIGGFDERFGHGNYEDDDWCLRARLRGHRLAIAQRAFLHHEGHATFRALGLDLAAELGRRRAQFAAKWHADPAGAAHLAAWRGDLAAAADAAHAARRRWPAWPDADWHLGRWLAARGEHAAAAVHFAALLRHCPEHADAALAAGRCALARGDVAGARAAFGHGARHLLPAASHGRVALDLGAHAYGTGAFADARRHFAAALDALPGDGAVHNWLGLCALAGDDLATAAAHFAHAVEAGFALAHTNLGICQLRQGAPQRARASFAAAVAALPDDRTARANLDRCDALLAG